MIEKDELLRLIVKRKVLNMWPKKHLLRMICRVLCKCPEHPRVSVHFGSTILTFKGDFQMVVKDSDGPFQVVVAGFVDAAGQPTTDTDTPVYASSNAAVATVDAAGVVTLTKAIGQVQIAATFGDPAAGGFTVTGDLDVQPGAAVSATMTFVPVAAAAPQ